LALSRLDSSTEAVWLWLLTPVVDADTLAEQRALYAQRNPCPPGRRAPAVYARASCCSRQHSIALTTRRPPPVKKGNSAPTRWFTTTGFLEIFSLPRSQAHDSGR
jgi:hypothetical protein